MRDPPQHEVIERRREGGVLSHGYTAYVLKCLWPAARYFHVDNASRYLERAALGARPKSPRRLPRFPTEQKRARAVVDRIVYMDAEVTCLQEVSGDTLELITVTVGRERVHSFQLPRVPRLRVGSSVLRDGPENLVIVTAGIKVHFEAFSDDDGKDFIAVRCRSGTLVVNTHISGDPKNSPLQLKALDAWISSQPGPVILCGDFNCDEMQMLQSLRPGWGVAVVRSDLKISRPKSNQLIDHIISWNGTEPVFANIENAGGISDHNLVITCDMHHERRN